MHSKTRILIEWNFISSMISIGESQPGQTIVPVHRLSAMETTKVTSSPQPTIRRPVFND